MVLNNFKGLKLFVYGIWYCWMISNGKYIEKRNCKYVESSVCDKLFVYWVILWYIMLICNRNINDWLFIGRRYVKKVF